MRKRGRPSLPDSELKHPRQKRLRQNLLSGAVLDIPPPSKEEMAKWAPIVDLCVKAVLSQPSRTDNRAKKNKVRLKMLANWVQPDEFPSGRIVHKEIDRVVREYVAEALLLWLYKNKYTQYNASLLYSMRRGVWMELACFERNCLNEGLDEDLLCEYDVG